MKPCGIVTLLTDFGAEDVFVGVMKGVILGIAPRARIVDISHAVPPQNMRVGSLFLGASARYFPHGTVHVAVVDPGVGSERRALAVETESAWFVAPDNGLLTDALRNAPVVRCVELTNPVYFLPSVSATFHGRDIFAPVGAYLARGISLKAMGTPVADFHRLPDEGPIQEGSIVRGRVVFADRFGNLVTNIRRGKLDGEVVSVRMEGREVGPARTSYASVALGAWLAVWNSFDLLEIARNGGNLAREIEWNPSHPPEVTVTLSRTERESAV